MKSFGGLFGIAKFDRYLAFLRVLHKPILLCIKNCVIYCQKDKNNGLKG